MKNKVISYLLVMAMTASMLTVGVSAEEAGGLASLKGNTNPTEEEIALANSTLDDSYLGDPYEAPIPNNYSAYPFESDDTLDIWLGLDDMQISMEYPDFNEHPVIKKLEEYTGINVNVIVPMAGEATTDLNLMIADRELPDILLNAAWLYAGGEVQMLEDGVALELTEAVDQYMPNYSQWMNSYDKLYKAGHIDGGSVALIFGSMGYEFPMYYGLLYKQEALDATGLPVPETVEEFHDFLVACKEAGYDTPFAHNVSNGFSGASASIESAWGIGREYLYIKEDGTVGYSPTADATYEYLKTVRSWVEEGLVIPDWATADFPQLMAYATSDDVAVVLESPDTMHSYWKTENGIEFVGGPNLVLNKGDQPLSAFNNMMNCGTVATISPTCENVEAACRFMDFMFTKKGWELINWGLYGETHLVDGEGVPYYHEDGIVLNDPEGAPLSSMTWKNRFHQWVGIGDEPRSNPLAADPESYSMDIRVNWQAEVDDSISWPWAVTYTPEESDRVATIKMDLDSLRNDYIVGIINGTRPLEDFAEYQKLAKELNVDEYVEISQAAFDRYNAR